MRKLVLLKFISGNFVEGFKVELQIRKGDEDYHSTYEIPPSPELPLLYNNFTALYYQLGPMSGIQVSNAQVTNYSLIENCIQAVNILENYLINNWFAQVVWQQMRLAIEKHFLKTEEFRIIINTDNIQTDGIYLKKLPWHLWNFFSQRNFAHTHFGLSAKDAERHTPLRYPVRILAIFGGDQGLDLTNDRQLLDSLNSQGAIVKQLIQPHPGELINHLQQQSWDILFFAGHSCSQGSLNSGEISINANQSIPLHRLRNCLETAVANGLKLAIFNSCDGLGLATDLDNVGVSQMIIMREPVPDEVARKFLQYFLANFVIDGKSFYLAIKETCRRLEEMEFDYPCASWLPIICQNPNAEPLRWSRLLWFSLFIYKIKKFANALFSRNQKKVLTFISLVALIAMLVVGLRNCNINNWNLVNLSNNSKPSPHQIVKPTIASPSPTIPESESWQSSEGEKYLITTNAGDKLNTGQNEYRLAISALQNRNIGDSERYFQKAINFYSQSLEKSRNDPQTRIYLNNAIAYVPKNIDKLTTADSDICQIPNNNLNNHLNPQPLKIAAVIGVNQNQQKGESLEILRGISQVQNEFNCKGGINGRLLHVTIFNDKDDKNLSREIAQKIVNNQDFIGVVGHISSQTLNIAATQYDNQIVAISPTSTAIRNNQYPMNKYIYRTAINDKFAIQNLVSYWEKKLNKPKIAVAYKNELYSQSFYEEFRNQIADKLPGSYVNTGEKCIFNQSFDAQQCIDAIPNDVRAMLIIPDDVDEKVMQFLQKVKDSNREFYLLSGDTMYNNAIRVPEADGLVVAVHWLRKQTDSNNRLQEKGKRFWNNSDVNWRTATADDALTVMTEALKQIIQQNPGYSNLQLRQPLQQLLSNQTSTPTTQAFTVDGVLGPIKFNNGDRIFDDNFKFGVLGKVECNTPTVSQNKCDFVQIDI